MSTTANQSQVDSYKNFSLDSVLTSQKDNLLHRINSCETGASLADPNLDQIFDDLKNVLFALKINRDLWISQSYGYKFNELRERILGILDGIQLVHCPPQAKSRAKKIRNLRTVIKLIEVPYELRIL